MTESDAFPGRGGWEETDTNTWLAALSLEPCEACPRPGVRRAAVGGKLAEDAAGSPPARRRLGSPKASAAAARASRRKERGCPGCRKSINPVLRRVGAWGVLGTVGSGLALVRNVGEGGWVKGCSRSEVLRRVLQVPISGAEDIISAVRG